MRKFLLVLLGLAICAAGCWAGLAWGWVGGIEQIVRGAEASPVNGGDIAWGLVRSIGLGDLMIGLGWTALWGSIAYGIVKD